MHNYLSLVKQHVKEDYAVIVIDNSDIAKPAGRKLEALSEIRDGSTGEITQGYLSIEAAVLSEARLDQQALDLFRGQHLHLSGFGGGKTAAIGGIAEDEFFSNGFVQCGVERGVDAPNGLIGESFAIELCPEEPAALFESGTYYSASAGKYWGGCLWRGCKPVACGHFHLYRDSTGNAAHFKQGIWIW